MKKKEKYHHREQQYTWMFYLDVFKISFSKSNCILKLEILNCLLFFWFFKFSRKIIIISYFIFSKFKMDITENLHTKRFQLLSRYSFSTWMLSINRAMASLSIARTQLSQGFLSDLDVQFWSAHTHVGAYSCPKAVRYRFLWQHNVRVHERSPRLRPENSTASCMFSSKEISRITNSDV